MAKFCKFCGTALEEGQVCSCADAQAAAAPVATPAPEAAPVATAAPAAPAAPGFGKKLVDTLKAYWKAPKATAAAVAEDAKGMTFAGVFAGINVLAVFFYLWRIIGMLLDGVVDGVKQSTGSKVDMDEIMELLEIEMPIVPMLVAGLAIAVLGIVATALVVFIAAKLNKQAVDLKKQIVVASIHSLIPSALLIAGILLGIANAIVMYFCFFS